MGKKVAVGQMNGYFLLVLADAIVSPEATECKKSWWVQAYVVGQRGLNSLVGGHNPPRL